MNDAPPITAPVWAIVDKWKGQRVGHPETQLWLDGKLIVGGGAAVEADKGAETA